MKREEEARHQFSLTEDKDLVCQIQKSSEYHRYGRIYTGDQGLKYLHSKVKEFENGQSL